MRFLKKLLKGIAWFIAIILVALLITGIYIYSVSDNIQPPAVANEKQKENVERKHVAGSLYTIEGNNWIRQSESGLYEMYVSGAPFELGLKNGKLSNELIVEQEVAFTDQIKQMIPSESYLKFLKYIVGYINKDLPDNVKEEYQEEIFGVSRSASDSFGWVGTKYQRILNYHSAHDVGHALQNMMLVGCTSFGAWDTKTTDGSMLIGRNFDFWVGDKFAENKIVAFYTPEKGHKFMFVTWGGFTGVVSGMNDQGLTVTINAARSDIPTGAATPVSLVAREVLQYAGNIDEAIAIAKSRTMFVSESFLVGSAKDHKAIIIEKTPDQLHIYDPNEDNIQCTNHYQSEGFKDQELNITQKEKSASVYRYKRLKELMQQNYPLTPKSVASILRDRHGLEGADIGNGNEKAVNQLIAHHSIIFQPDSMRVWVSTNPWQLGQYVCYDLRKIFSMPTPMQDVEISDTGLNIPADSFIYTQEYQDFLRFRKNKMSLLQGGAVDTAEVIHNNPNYYDAYRVAGDYCAGEGWYKQAIAYYQQALELEIATLDERTAIEKKIAICKKKLKQ